jgi:hypothetical protein
MSPHAKRPAGEKTPTAKLVAALPESVGNITFTPDNQVIFFNSLQPGRIGH